MEVNMNNVIQYAKSKQTDFDQIRKQLESEGLTYPSDSPDPRYKDVINYCKEHSIPVEVVHDWNGSRLADTNTDFSTVCQCRVENIDEEKVSNYSERFKKGESLVYPIIAFEHGGYHYPVFGNQRSHAIKRSGALTSILLVGNGLSYEEKRAAAKHCADISNRKTNLDVDTDTSEDIKYQMRTEWEEVLATDPKERSTILKKRVNTKVKYYKLLEEDDDDAAEKCKRDYFVDWFATVKPDTLSKCEKSKNIQFGQAYSEAFSETIKQRLPDNYYKDKKVQEEIYLNYWSELKEEDGELVEQYGWDPDKNSYKNNSDVVQIFTGGSNPHQNIRRQILEMAYNGKTTSSVEIMIRASLKCRDVENIRADEDKWKKSFTADMLNPNKKVFKLPDLSKITFCQHTTTGHETTAWEWKKTATGGFFKKVEKII
jgi:hypothetical protein